MSKIFTNFAAVLFTAALTIGMVACNKSSDVVNTGSPVSQNAPKNIMRFDSYEALSLAINRSLEMAMSQNVMKAPGQGTPNGFLSFGELADMAYEEVAQYQDDYKSIEEVRAAIAQHSDYLQLIQDENGEYELETKLYQSPTKYIVNVDKMYQVKDTLVKTLEEYTILTPEKNYSELLKVDETNINSYLNNPDFLVVDNIGEVIIPGQGNGNNPPPASLGRKLVGQKSDNGGSDKRHRRLTATFQIWTDIAFGYSNINEYCLMTIKSQRKDMWNVCWYNWARPIDFDVTPEIYGGGNYLNSMFYFRFKDYYNVWKINQKRYFSYQGSDFARFIGISGYVQSPEFKITSFNPK